MLYGQNLPWRYVLRRTAALGANGKSSSIAAARHVHLHSISRSSQSASRRPTPHVSSRVFSSSPLNRREDAGHKKRDVPEETAEVDKEKASEEDLRQSESEVKKTPDPIPSAKSTESNGRASAGGGDAGDGKGDSNSGSGGGGRKKRSSDKSLQKPTVPEVYPQVMAIPIAKRPLFPGFYKAISIKNPQVMSAIDDAIKAGQPYIGAFLLRDENADIDVDLPLSRANIGGIHLFCVVFSSQ